MKFLKSYYLWYILYHNVHKGFTRGAQNIVNVVTFLVFFVVKTKDDKQWIIKFNFEGLSKYN
ncbi:hypothetical protein ASG21_06810 [Chryseobacterium sp. Leaf394]|nr:hypothetical protein ASG21_06810 [Chryseobacterium sp. Leaf394]